jgi:hypothetical protein
MHWEAFLEDGNLPRQEIIVDCRKHLPGAIYAIFEVFVARCASSSAEIAPIICCGTRATRYTSFAGRRKTSRGTPPHWSSCSRFTSAEFSTATLLIRSSRLWQKRASSNSTPRSGLPYQTTPAIQFDPEQKILRIGLYRHGFLLTPTTSIGPIVRAVKRTLELSGCELLCGCVWIFK